VRFYPWLLIGLGILLLVTSGKDMAARELDALQGTWRFVAVEAEGARVVEEVVCASRLVVTGDRFELFTPDAVHAGVIRLDPSRSPRLIDIEYTSGPERGKWALGIYSLGDRELWVCIGLPERDRPTAFSTAPGSGHLLEYLERESVPADR
jgi:uncharacterized protein (TIGR03067 family)